MEQLSIKQAAIKWGDMIVTMPRPNRHGDIFRAIEETFNPPEHKYGECGFLDSELNFRGRVQSRYIAQDAGQIVHDDECGFLTTENLW